MSDYDLPSFADTHTYNFYAELVLDKKFDITSDIASVLAYIRKEVGVSPELIDFNESDDFFTSISVDITAEVDVEGYHDIGDAEVVDKEEMIAQLRLIDFVEDCN